MVWILMQSHGSKWHFLLISFFLFLWWSLASCKYSEKNILDLQERSCRNLGNINTAFLFQNSFNYNVQYRIDVSWCRTMYFLVTRCQYHISWHIFLFLVGILIIAIGTAYTLMLFSWPWLLQPPDLKMIQLDQVPTTEFLHGGLPRSL